MTRGITPATAFAFKLGFAPSTAALFRSLATEGFTPEELVLAGLCVNSTESTSNMARKDPVYQSSNNPKFFDRFRNRLMIPIRRADGQVVGFGGRALEDSNATYSSLKYNPKYLNSPETMVFKKNTLLFGYDLARAHIKESGTAIVVEGYFDMMALYNTGVKNVVATMGTAISAEQLLSLADRSNPRVTSIVLLMDADEAGIESVRRTCLHVLNKLPDDINVKIGR
jgi:DNA primase